MDDPIRFVDDVEAPAVLREALRGAPRAARMEEETRARLGARVARLAAVPVSVATLLSVKGAAAVGIGLGIVTASVSVGLFEYAERRSESARETEPAVKLKPPALQRTRAPAGSPESPAPPVEALDPAPDLPSRSAPPPPAAPPSAGGLAEESALLEGARRAVAAAPEVALSRVREHARRFPRGQLASERALLEIDALYRLGRRAEARSLAEQRLAQGGDDLYTARVRRLLEKIESGR
jgi:type IV secretory pathway VirB10-like protein